MRAVVQRVATAQVVVNGNIEGSIHQGLLVFLGIEDADTTEDLEWLVQKIVQLRIFNNKEGIMNLSVKENGGDILLISQFTLFASTKKGNRPSYSRAAKGNIAILLYEKAIQFFEKAMQKPIATGVFGADMKVHLQNDGPVTIVIDTKQKE